MTCTSVVEAESGEGAALNADTALRLLMEKEFMPQPGHARNVADTQRTGAITEKTR